MTTQLLNLAEELALFDIYEKVDNHACCYSVKIINSLIGSNLIQLNTDSNTFTINITQKGVKEVLFNSRNYILLENKLMPVDQFFEECA